MHLAPAPDVIMNSDTLSLSTPAQSIGMRKHRRVHPQVKAQILRGLLVLKPCLVSEC